MWYYYQKNERLSIQDYKKTSPGKISHLARYKIKLADFSGNHISGVDFIKIMSDILSADFPRLAVIYFAYNKIMDKGETKNTMAEIVELLRNKWGQIPLKNRPWLVLNDNPIVTRDDFFKMLLNPKDGINSEDIIRKLVYLDKYLGYRGPEPIRCVPGDSLKRYSVDQMKIFYKRYQDDTDNLTWEEWEELENKDIYNVEWKEYTPDIVEKTVDQIIIYSYQNGETDKRIIQLGEIVLAQSRMIGSLQAQLAEIKITTSKVDDITQSLADISNKYKYGQCSRY